MSQKPPPETIEEKFNRLRAQWLKDTKYLSFHRTDHPAYMEIMTLGRDVIPYIIADINQNNTTFWWQALEAILGKRPEIPKYAAGRLTLINMLWIAWYEEEMYEWNRLRVVTTVIEKERRKQTS